MTCKILDNHFLEAAIKTKAVRPGKMPVHSANKVRKRVDEADKMSNRYISQACRLQ